ncbi:hypothetical protein AVEN_177668-1 [Araneus ventricosus]|uniref:Uncharacterized protein n=1 Tax=Araneus ventricosus TaxID=182803 RepID=A0A4Y2BME5_ARAVE|nr:hypothetical protein AVEN_177668-1 [Araneus ventricosus]
MGGPEEVGEFLHVPFGHPFPGVAQRKHHIRKGVVLRIHAFPQFPHQVQDEKVPRIDASHQKRIDVRSQFCARNVLDLLPGIKGKATIVPN